MDDEDFFCPYCGEPWLSHELLTSRPPRWLCPDGLRYVKTLAHTNGVVTSGPDMIETRLEYL